jgi:hypothetical protein
MFASQVYGNIIRGERIAGLIYIVQESTQVLQGFITQINYTTGHFWVDTLECVLNEFVNKKFCGPN